MNNKHKELVLEKNGKLLVKEKIYENKLIKKNQVRVKPLNVGVCSSDIPRCFDEKAYFYPLIIGHEFSVIILEDPLNQFKPNQRCAVFPLKPCFNCVSCSLKEFNKCSSYSYYGSRTEGGMQTFLDIDRWNLIPVPEGLDNISISLIEPLAVCIHTSKLLDTKNVKNILLYGGGFLSQILSQILLNLRVKVTCVDRNEYKKDFFDNEISFFSSTNELNDSLFDVTIECCGADGILEDCVRLTKTKGEIIQLANPSVNSSINSQTLSKLMRKELSLKGTWNSLYRPDKKTKCEWQESIKMLVEKKINLKHLISHEVGIDESAELIEKIFLRRVNKDCLPKFNKAIVKVSC